MLKIVKLTYNFDWPIFRQTPNNDMIWKEYKFIIDDDLKECDYWVIYSDFLLKDTIVKCNPNNIIFIPGEGYSTSPNYGQKFLDQFSQIITVQRELRHKNVVYFQNGLPWFVNKSYKELNTTVIPKKNKLLSVICSNKTITEGHRKRLDFVLKLKDYFKEDIDVYGRGFKEINDKSIALINYKYSIAIENDFILDYVTEKFFDCLYSNTLTFYYGCPNLESYVNPNAFIRIDINNVNESINIIKNAIKNREYEKRKIKLLEVKLNSLNKDQFFPLIVSFLDKLKTTNKKKELKFNSNILLEYSSLKNKFFNLLKKIKRRL